MSNTVSIKSLKLRIFPSEEQKQLIEKTFGCCRLIYNNRIDERVEFYTSNILPIKNKSKEEKAEVYKTFHPSTEKEMKAKFPYMLEVSDRALQYARTNCEKAFSNFFKSRSGKRKGRKIGFPQYKTKKQSHQSYQEYAIDKNRHFNFNEKTIKIPKLGKVKFFERELPNWWKIVESFGTCTISRTASNRYYISILCNLKHEFVCKEKLERKEAIGLDFTMKDALFYTDSEGNTAREKYGYAPQKQANHKKLRKLQRRLTRRQRIQLPDCPRKINSSNREKARIKLAKFEEKIANKRMNWIELETKRLAKSYDKVVVEDLNLEGIKQVARNAKNVQDAAWATFVSKLESKGKFYNCNVIKADRFFPSSQLCHVCGFKNIEVKDLSVREWTCSECGTNHLRDVNAALNLRNYIPTQHRESTTMDSEKKRKSIKDLAELALKDTLVGVTTEAEVVSGCREAPHNYTPKSL